MSKELAVVGLLRDIKRLEQDDGVIVTDFEEILGLFKKWFPTVFDKKMKRGVIDNA